jgi:ABC-2 type transport system permease protein
MLPGATYGFNSTWFMSILVPGVLTMRCFAEERRSGSIEALMTAPVRDSEVVLGKWLAATAFFAFLWLPTVVELHLTEYEPWLNADLAFGPVFCAYLGMFLLSGLLLAFGCFASSLTDNVLLAAMLSIMFSTALIMRLPHWIAAQFGDVTQNYYVRELLDKIDVSRNFSEWFARGLIDTSQVAFFIGGIAFFLFLTGISVASRRIA